MTLVILLAGLALVVLSVFWIVLPVVQASERSRADEPVVVETAPRETDMRVTLGWWFVGAGGLGMLIAYWLYQQESSEMRVELFAYGFSSERSPLPMLLGIAGALALFAGITMFVMVMARPDNPKRPSGTALVPGWYDDPDSPAKLRYWDGAAWTDRSADKSPD